MSGRDVDLSALRSEYGKGRLTRGEGKSGPEALFRRWLDEAVEVAVSEPNAFSLGTVDADGQSFQRTVLLKGYDARGLVIFTNLESRKAVHIRQNAKVSALFFWPDLERQVMVLGEAFELGRGEVLKYFATRPFASRLGAWVSPQSSVISSRGVLEAKFAEMKRKFVKGEVPLPDFWGGYRIVPRAFEFWQGGAGRLHDRFFFERENDSEWSLKRLAP